MATAQDYNHIHPKSGESYGHMHSKGGDHHLTADHSRGSSPGGRGNIFHQSGGRSGEHVGPGGLE